MYGLFFLSFFACLFFVFCLVFLFSFLLLFCSFFCLESLNDNNRAREYTGVSDQGSVHVCVCMRVCVCARGCVG